MFWWMRVCKGKEEKFYKLGGLERTGSWEEMPKASMYSSEEWVCSIKKGVSSGTSGGIEVTGYTELKSINEHSLQWQDEKIRRIPSVGEDTALRALIHCQCEWKLLVLNHTCRTHPAETHIVFIERSYSHTVRHPKHHYKKIPPGWKLPKSTENK